jgi:hypothetical protein
VAGSDEPPGLSRRPGGGDKPRRSLHQPRTRSNISEATAHLRFWPAIGGWGPASRPTRRTRTPLGRNKKWEGGSSPPRGAIAPSPACSRTHRMVRMYSANSEPLGRIGRLVEPSATCHQSLLLYQSQSAAVWEQKSRAICNEVISSYPAMTFACDPFVPSPPRAELAANRSC